MAWIIVPGLAGKVYVPDEKDQAHQKHPCKTCFSCQWCDETRCRLCREENAATDRGDVADGGRCGRPQTDR